jgi:5-methylcytosine-specific restriction endonuclease McrA
MGKICYRCKQEKETKEFNKSKDKPDGLTSWCKSCLAEKKRKERHGEGKKTYRQSSGRVDPLVPIETYITDICEICNKEFLPRGPKYKRCDDCAYIANWKVYKALVRYKTDNATVNDVTKRYIQTETCNYCKRGFTEDNPKWLDHVNPRSLGGTNKSDNIEIVCKECNLSKAGLSLEAWIALCKRIVENFK